LAELLKDLSRLLLLAGREVLPGFHAVEHAILLLRWQARKMLQAVLQLLLLSGGQLAELGITLKSPALLLGR
jgi:hypothetical protein